MSMRLGKWSPRFSSRCCAEKFGRQSSFHSFPFVFQPAPKKLERRARREVDQVRGTAAIGGAKAWNWDLALRHPLGNLAPEAFLRFIPQGMPDLHYAGRFQQIIDMPAKPFFALQMALHPCIEASLGTAHVYVMACGKGECAQPSYGNRGLFFQNKQQSISALFHRHIILWEPYNGKQPAYTSTGRGKRV
jgi:hypothetical protein